VKKITIGFSTPKKFRVTSWLIRKFEGSEFSHIYIKMNPSPKSSLNFSKVFQASHGDVNAMTFDNFLEGNKIIHEYAIEVSDEKYFEVATWLWKQLGKPYGFTQLLAIGLGIKTRSNKDSRYICSELAGMVLRDYLGYNINDTLDFIGLNDIKDILEKNK
jgi:hypothetical protein